MNVIFRFFVIICLWSVFTPTAEGVFRNLTNGKNSKVFNSPTDHHGSKIRNLNNIFASKLLNEPNNVLNSVTLGSLDNFNLDSLTGTNCIIQAINEIKVYTGLIFSKLSVCDAMHSNQHLQTAYDFTKTVTPTINFIKQSNIQCKKVEETGNRSIVKSNECNPNNLDGQIALLKQQIQVFIKQLQTYVPFNINPCVWNAFAEVQRITTARFPKILRKCLNI